MNHRKFVNTLKKAIGKTTAYRLHKKTGVRASAISRFVSGKRDINLATASKLAGELGLRLTKR